MRLWQPRRLGSRVLRRGARGEDVARLQDRLDELGYRVGARDGIYGYLLEDAVRQLQREHRLRVDGIAGPQVVALLRDRELDRSRRVHIVAEGERLSDIAAGHDLSVSALRLMNRLHSRKVPYPGQRLLIRSRMMLGGLHPERVTPALAWLNRSRSGVSAVAAMWWRVDGDGQLTTAQPELPKARLAALGMPVWAGVHSWQLDGTPTGGHAALHGRRRTRLVEACLDIMRDRELTGLLLDIGPLALGDGAPLMHLVHALASALRKAGKPLFVAVPPVRPGWIDDLDWTRLSRDATRLILATHHSTGAHPCYDTAATERAIQRAVRRVYPWRLLVGEPAATYERLADRWLERDYASGMAAAYLNRTRPSWDADHEALHALGVRRAPGSPKDEPAEELEWEVWIENSESFKQRLLQLERYNLDGMFLWRLGDGDPRAVSHVPGLLRVAHW